MAASIQLEQDQQELLAKLVEAHYNVPRAEREEFSVFLTGQGQDFVHHPGLPDKSISVFVPDLKILDRARLIDLSHTPKGTPHFHVTPEGITYYRQMKTEIGKPVEAIEDEVRRYLDAPSFQKKYPTAYRHWVEAEQLLWVADTEDQVRTIGHHCREALQEFATVLVDHYRPPDVDRDKAHDANRVSAVLRQHQDKLGKRERAFLDALLGYWRAVSDLVQRQVHGSQKPGTDLVREDARRVVFQTAIVMFELDRSLTRLR